MAIYGHIRDNRAITAGRDTGPAKLPALPRINVADNPELTAWVRNVTERLEVREGTRGNDAERVVTQREFKEARELVQVLKEPKTAGPGEMVIGLGNGFDAVVAVDGFADMIRGLKLYQDLMKRLDDPSRFDDLRGEVREILLRDIAEEAALRGAEIRRTERLINDTNLSLAIRFEEVTAAIDSVAAGVRETFFASAEVGRAQAGKITQIVASLGNYYQDGTPGRVALESQMTATADKVEGLRGQYTLKIQAGGAIAGFGLSATEKDGVPDSAFIISANKFAIVNPATYTGGLTNTPDTTHIPFGVDGNGIYMNSAVYLKGTLRVDSGGKTLIDGLRGSIMASAGGSWSDTTARNLIWQKLGKSGSAPNNNHLVIGDTVTLGTGQSAVSRMWNGSSWINPGVFINGNVVVDGSLAAQKIDTRGLTIRDALGNVVVDSTGVSVDRVRGRFKLTNDPSTTQLEGNNSTPLLGTDFLSRYQKINGNTFDLFIDKAAIGSAAVRSLFVGEASIDTLSIRGNSVTSPKVFTGSSGSTGPKGGVLLARGFLNVPAGSSGTLLIAMVALSDTGSGGETYKWRFSFWRNSTLIYTTTHHYGTHDSNYANISLAYIDVGAPAGNHRYDFGMDCIVQDGSAHTTYFRDPVMVAMGAHR